MVTYFAGSITVWGDIKETAGYMKPLVKLQKQFIRLIAKRQHREPTAALFLNLDILPLNRLYVYRVALTMRPFIVAKADGTPSALTVETIHDYPLVSRTHRHATRRAITHEYGKCCQPL